MLIFLAFNAQAAVLAGVAYVPPGIGALAFDDADAWSGTLAGEWDGWLRPPLTAHAGWVGGRHAVLGNIAVVEQIANSYADNTHLFSVGGVRIGADWRGYVWPREAGRVNVWPTAGMFGIIPNSAESDTSYTTEETDQAAQDSRERRARIGGIGAQAGIGAEYCFGDAAGKPAFSLGAKWVLRGFGGLDLADQETDFSMFLVSEAALVLEFTR